MCSHLVRGPGPLSQASLQNGLISHSTSLSQSHAQAYPCCEGTLLLLLQAAPGLDRERAEEGLEQCSYWLYNWPNTIAISNTVSPYIEIEVVYLQCRVVCVMDGEAVVYLVIVG